MYQVKDVNEEISGHLPVMFSWLSCDPQDVTIACTRNIFPAETLDFVGKHSDLR